MKTKTLSLLMVGLFLLSCNNISENRLNEETETLTNEYHHHEETENIELNNGEKWIVDAEMMFHINNMEQDVNSFSVGQNDYRALAEKLQIHLDLLTSNCTMKGQAHDELHKWLLPYMGLVDALSNSKDDKNDVYTFKKIQTAITLFNQYFQ